ncbi:MAG: ArsA-related P-loop ATPase [Acidimicrobiales bacterium]
MAFIGKGGAGKSALAGTFARLLAQRGERVLVIDSDPMPGLALSIGMPPTDAGIPDEAMVEKAEGEAGPRFRLRAGLSASDAVERYALRGPGGIRVLQFGKAHGHLGALVRSQHAFHQIREELPPDDWHLVGDLPGGTRQPFFGWARFASTLLIVVEPNEKGLLAARRLAHLADADPAPDQILAVVNKARGPGDAELVQSRTGLAVVATVPWDDEFADAERRGFAPFDAAPECLAVQAVASLVERLHLGGRS